MATKAGVPARSAGQLLGWGVFTTIGVRNGRPILMPEHLRRLRHDAEKAQCPLPWTDEELHEATLALISKNGLVDGLARWTVTRRGDGRWNTQKSTDVLLTMERVAPTSPLRASLTVSPYHFAAKRPLAGCKLTSYLPYQLAWQEAHDAGWDDAVVCTENEIVAETCRANLFWYAAGRFYTPALSTGCLAGVGRQSVLTYLRSYRWQVDEVEWTIGQIRRAHEFVTVSAAAGPRWVTRMDCRGVEPELNGGGFLLHHLNSWWHDLLEGNL